MAVSLTRASAAKYTAARDPVDSLQGEKRLAAAVIASALREKDTDFLASPGFAHWCGILEISPVEARERAMGALDRLPRRGRPRKARDK